MRELRRDLHDHQQRDDDSKKAIDTRVGQLEARRLLQDATRLEAHVRRRPDRDEKRDQADEPADEAAEETAHAVRNDEHDWKDVDPGQLLLPPK